MEEQARINADAMLAAARAGQAADALGPGQRASSSPGASAPNATPHGGSIQPGDYTATAAKHSGSSPVQSTPEAGSPTASGAVAEQRGSRKSSMDRKTERQPEQDALLQPFCSPRKAARQRLSEQSAARARAELVRGRKADMDMHAADATAARLLEEKWSGAQGSEEGFKADKRRPVLAQVDRRLFGRILFSFDTMPHHLPDTYLTALQEL